MKLPYIQPCKRYGQKFFDYGKLFREIALDIDNDPDYIFNHVSHPACQFLMNDKSSTVFERTCYLEALSYGDPGVILTAPGPSLAGLVVRELGTSEQIDEFYQYISDNQARTFFALTEPDVGSDANNIKCTLNKSNDTKQYYLSGEKCLVGNAAVAKIGIVVARVNNGPLGIRLILIKPDLLLSKNEFLYKQSLPMVGLKAAQIGYIKFKNCPLGENSIIGNRLNPLSTGMATVIKTFNRLRTGVGALAVGQAQAVLDYMYEDGHINSSRAKSEYTNLYYQLEACRMLLKKSAKEIDANANETSHASMAKVQATITAKSVIEKCCEMMGMDILVANQWIGKCFRDSFAWEYMEGTRHMQYQNIANMYLNVLLQNGIV